jgi:peroxiredoxin
MKGLAQLAQVAFILVAAFAVYSFVGAARDGEHRRVCAPLCHLHPNYAARNRLAPDFDLPTVGGSRVRLSSFRGKVVVLNFWTKNCGPCLEEMPSMGELSQILRAEPDIVVLTVSTDDTVDDVRGTLRSVLGADAPFTTAIDPESAVVAGKYGTKLYPETWIIDPRGVIRARFDGARDWTNPLIADFLKSLREPLACAVQFENGKGAGDDAALCDDIAG